jgi:hypothetical protein
VPGRLVIRKNISDLTIAQTEDAFKSVQQATFAINADEVKKSTTYNIQGVIGYALGQAAIPSWPYAYAEFIPYIAYTGQFVHGNNPNKLTDVNNVGVGFLGDLLFPGSALQNALPFGRGIYNDVQASLEEVHSEISATDILSAKLTYTPFFDHNYLPGVGNSAPVGDYFITFTPQAVFIFGNVLDNGGNPNLSKTGNYQRLGAHLAFNVSAVAGIFNGFSFTTTYDYLRSYGGPVSDIALFTSTLSYAMPQQNLWSVQLQYQDGRNLDTLVQQKLITLGLGLKY